MKSPSVAPAEVEAVRRVVAAQRNSTFFQRRYRRNVQSPPQRFSREEFWKQMIVCICTSV